MKFIKKVGLYMKAFGIVAKRRTKKRIDEWDKKREEKKLRDYDDSELDSYTYDLDEIEEYTNSEDNEEIEYLDLSSDTFTNVNKNNTDNILSDNDELEYIDINSDIINESSKTIDTLPNNTRNKTNKNIKETKRLAKEAKKLEKQAEKNDKKQSKEEKKLSKESVQKDKIRKNSSLDVKEKKKTKRLSFKDKKKLEKIESLSVTNEISDDDDIINLLSNKKVKTKKSKEVKKEKKSSKTSNLSYLLSADLSDKKVLVIEVKKYKTYIIEASISGNTKITGKWKINIHNRIEVENPSGTWQDGILGNIKNLAISIVKALMDNNIKTKNVIWVCNSESVLSREIDHIPLQKNKKVNDELIMDKAEDIFPVDLSNYVLDYKVICKNKTEDVLEDKDNTSKGLNTDLKDIIKINKKTSYYKLMVYAAPKPLIASFNRLAKICSLNTTHIDCCSNSIINIISKYYNESNTVFVEIGDLETNIYTSVMGEIINQRKLSIGYDTITKKAMDYRLLGNTSDEIFTYLKDNKLLEDDNSLRQYIDSIEDFEEKDTINEIIEDIRSEIVTIIEQISIEIESNEREHKELKIDNIVLVSSIDSFPNITEDILDICKREVVIPDIFFNINANNKYNRRFFIESLHTIGSLIEPINFKENTGDSLQESKSVNKIVFALISVTGIAILGIVFILNNDLTNVRMENEDIINKLEDARAAETIYKRSAKAIETYNILNNFDESFSTVSYASDIISDIEKVSPSTSLYDSVVINEKSVVLNVRLDSKIEAVKLIEELEKLPYFSSIEISGITENYSEENISGRVTFSINCLFKEDTEFITAVTGSDAMEEKINEQ